MSRQFDKRLSEIRIRAGAATKGPWHADQWTLWTSDLEAKTDCFIFGDDIDADMADVEFIAHSRQDIPWLVEQIDRLTKRNAHIEDKLKILEAGTYERVKHNTDIKNCGWMPIMKTDYHEMKRRLGELEAMLEQEVAARKAFQERADGQAPDQVELRNLLQEQETLLREFSKCPDVHDLICTFAVWSHCMCKVGPEPQCTCRISKYSNVSK